MSKIDKKQLTKAVLGLNKKEHKKRDRSTYNTSGLIPFKAGYDARRNVKANGVSEAAQLKQLMKMIWDEPINDEAGKEIATRLVAKLRYLTTSKNPADTTIALDRSFGKVPDDIAVSVEDARRIINILPPDAIDQLAIGESLTDVIIRIISDYNAREKKTG